MKLSSILNTLDQLRAIELPGSEAHKEVAPATRLEISKSEIQSRKPKEAAVVTLLYQNDQGTHILLTKRKPYNGVHGSQISFPGGKREEMDSDFWACARRECHEETGIIIPESNLIKSLSPIYIPPSNFYVYPYLAFMQSNPDFIPDDKEVDYIIDFPLKELMNQETLQDVKIRTNQGFKMNVKAYVFQEEIIWGATAIILSELKYILRNLDI